MIYDHYFPNMPSRPVAPPEPPEDPVRDRLFDALDALRHEAFALQNQLFAAPGGERAHLKGLLAQNESAQAALNRDMVRLDWAAPGMKPAR